MENLTPERQVKLDALLARLETLPTPEAIVEAIHVRGLDWSTEQGKEEYRRAMAGGIAAEKMLSYLLALRDFEQFRNTLGGLIYEHRLRPMPTREEEVDDYVQSGILAIQNSGLQEVTVHFFCNCVMHLHKLLQKATAGAGHVIPQNDLEVLNAYRDLRNYYEHIENRLPGHVNAGEVVRETITEDEWRIESGLQTDDQGHILLKGKAIDVTARGLERIEEVVQRHWDLLKPAALDGVRRYFETNPSNIPPPGTVNRGLLVSTRGA